MKFYLAGPFDDRERLRGREQQLQDLGYESVSHWLDEHGGDADYATGTPAHFVECANRDMDNIDEVDIVILDLTTRGSTTGGMYVELGYSMGRLYEGLLDTIYIVGKPTNVFTYLPYFRAFESWEELLTHLGGANA